MPADSETAALIASKPILRRIVEGSADIRQEPPDSISFQHSVMCQLGMPRSQPKSRQFERSSGCTSLLMEAGQLYLGGKWVELPLPYGTRPRLALIHMSTQAIQTRSKVIEIGRSVREYMRTLGISTDGREYARFKRQIEALSACKVTLGMSKDGADVTLNTQPIRSFKAWFTKDGQQGSMWPGVVELSDDFFETLLEHAVPLDNRAIGMLQHSPLGLDIYTWLAQRLYRVRSAKGSRVSWAALRSQFGHEYADPRNFKRKFKTALRQVYAAYPTAKIEEIDGGLRLFESPPPVTPRRRSRCTLKPRITAG
ncbi:MAG: replication protein RepA [Planctomycetota bacterium]